MNERGDLASTADWRHEYPLAELAAIFKEAQLPYALIGGLAVNAWVRPRATNDVGFVVLARRDAIQAVEQALLNNGFTHVRRQDSGEGSGPDFVQMYNRELGWGVDLQVAKTEYQEEIIRRAVVTSDDGIAVATPEDVVVLKLIANRSVDNKDLLNLAELPNLDWAYIERWAATWQVEDRLQEVRDLMERHPR